MPGEPIWHLFNASWYQNLVKGGTNAFDPEREFTIPLILYIDGTSIDAYGRYKLEPLNIALAILKPRILVRTSSWHLLTLVPDLKLDSKARKARKCQSRDGLSANSRNYHRCLKAGLDCKGRGWNTIYTSVILKNK